MRVTAGSVMAEAAALFRRDRGVLIALAGPFWFLPAYALALLVPNPPQPAATATVEARTQQMAAWLVAQGPWFLLSFAAALWGTATIYLLYMDAGRPTIGEALGRGLRLWPRLLLAMTFTAMAMLLLAVMLAPLPGGVGLVVWTMAAFYGLGRVLPVGPALAAERPLSAIGAIRRAWRMTRGAALPLGVVVAATLGIGVVADQPFLLLDGWLRANAGGVNPVAVAIVDAGAAAVAAAAGLASALVAVAAYRRLAR